MVNYSKVFKFVEMKYKISEYAKLKQVTYRTVWNWVKKDLVKYEKTVTGRIYIIE